MKKILLSLLVLATLIPLEAREIHRTVDIAFPAKDQNHDGKITSKEAFSGFSDYLQGKGDLDGNGSVSKEELQKAAAKQPKQKQTPTVTVNFNDLDTNGDGNIDTSEIKQFSKNMSLVSNSRDVTGYGGDSRSKVMDSATDVGFRIRF